MRPELSYLHRFIRGTDKTTLLLLHGTGGDENDIIPIGKAISAESSVLSPRGRVLENGLPRFFRRIREGVFDLQDVKFRSIELSEFVREASLRYDFKLDSVIAVGYSNGANLASGILLLQLLPLAGAILFRPMTPLVPDTLPTLKGLPLFVSAGTKDPYVPKGETARLVGLFEDCGAEVVLNWENAGHGISEIEVRKAREWFDLGFHRRPTQR